MWELTEDVVKFCTHKLTAADFIVVFSSIVLEVLGLAERLKIAESQGFVLVGRFWRYVRVGHGGLMILVSASAGEVHAMQKALEDHKRELEDHKREHEFWVQEHAKTGRLPGSETAGDTAAVAPQPGSTDL